jgi:hypothetical protein
MSRSINLYIPQHVASPEDIVQILNGAIGVKANLRTASPNAFWIDILTKQEKSLICSGHFSSGTLPNHIALHGDDSPELEHILRLIRKVAGGMLQVWEDGREVIEHPIRESWSTDNGLLFTIKQALMDGDMENEDDIVGLMNRIANKSFGYSISHPMHKVMEMFKD